MWAFIFLLPLLWSLIVAFGYAFGRAAFFSFTDYNLFHPPAFVGIANYLELFRHHRFLLALTHSLVFAAVVTSCQTFLALLLAMVLNQRIRGLSFFRASFYLPSILSTVIVGLVFIWFTFRRGTLNFLITLIAQHYPYLLGFLAAAALAQLTQVFWQRRKGYPTRLLDPVHLWGSLLAAAVGMWVAVQFGLIEPAVRDAVEVVWLQTRATFLGIGRPLWAIMGLNIVTTVPTMMLFFLAGLQDIPDELYEAAELDGVSPWQRLYYITVPTLRPVLFLVITLGLIGTIQMFDQVAIVGGMAPLDSVITLAYYVYWNMFGAGGLPQVGMASAAAMVLAALTLAIILIQRRFLVSEKGW